MGYNPTAKRASPIARRGFRVRLKKGTSRRRLAGKPKFNRPPLTVIQLVAKPWNVSIIRSEIMPLAFEEMEQEKQ
jgi:hypothetical protein